MKKIGSTIRTSERCSVARMVALIELAKWKQRLVEGDKLGDVSSVGCAIHEQQSDVQEDGQGKPVIIE